MFVKLLRILLVFLICPWALDSFAQSTIKIEGFVYSESGIPLEGANVSLQGSSFGAATDASGYYAVENLFVGIYDLRVSFLGYRAIERKGVVVHKDITTRLDFKLKSTILLFDELVVEAERTKATASGFQEVLTARDIRDSHAGTLGELLVQVPGVDIVDGAGGSNGKRVSIRGSNTNQVLVVVDGVVLNDPLTGDVDLNQLSLATIDEVRIHKGGNSSGFGSGALGGVIEIKSKSSAFDEIGLDSRFGSFEARTVRPSVSGNSGRFGYSFSAEFAGEQGDFPYAYQAIDGATVRESRINADFSSQNYFGKLFLDFGKHAFRLQGNLYNTDRGLPGLVFGLSPFATAAGQRRILIGQYTFLSSRFGARVQASQHLNETEFQNDLPPDVPLRFRTVSPYHTRYRVLSHRGSANVSYKAPGGHLFEVSGSVQRDDFADSDLLRATAGPVNQTENMAVAGFFRNEWLLPNFNFFTTVSLNSNLRVDQIVFNNGQTERTDFEVSPRVGVVVSRKGKWRIGAKANWGKSFRAPTFADLFFQDLRVKGNADLLPERSTDVDAGLQVGIPLGGSLELSSTYFRHAIDNLIIWELGSFATWRPFNTDALLKGWELGGAWHLWQNRLQVRVSHVILNALDKSGRRTTDSKRLIYRPERTTKFDLRFDFDRLTLNYHRRMVGRRYETQANTVALPPYAVDDLTLVVKPSLDNLDFRFKLAVLNMLDERYQIVERAPLPGRSWRAGLEITY